MESLPIEFPKTEIGNCVKLFVELMIELVHDYSWDNYRHFAMNLNSRLIEAGDTARDVSKEILPRIALDPIIEELCWSLPDEPVIKRMTAFDVPTYISMISDKSRPIESLRNLLTSLIRRTSPAYKEACEQDILAVLASPQRKAELVKVTKIYCSHLISIGYHRKYIEECLHQPFLSRVRASIGQTQVKSFFSRFGDKNHSYTVIGKADRHLVNALTRTAVCDHLNVSSVRSTFISHKPDFFSLQPKVMLFVLEGVPGKDHYSARQFAEQMLHAARAIILSIPTKLKPDWSDDAYVVRERSPRGIVLTRPPRPLDRRPQVSLRTTLRSTSETSDRIFEAFEGSSTSRYLRSLSTSALARTSVHLETQLISLWSAIEVLLSEPQAKTARIAHYADLLVPCLCLKYSRTSIVKFYDDLKKTYGSQLVTIANKEPIDGDQYSKFARILIATDRDELKQELLNMCSGSPLALRRAFTMHQALSTPSGIRSFITAHERMVYWQLHRIYRVRNSLVHSGKSPGFLESVLGNLDEYYRTATGTILGRAARVPEPSDIDQVVTDIGLEYKMYVAFLNSKKNEASIAAEEVEKFIVR